MNNSTSKIVVILGPTSSGKTKLGIKLAEQFQGEIVSADSRQVYTYMDIGTGKDLEEYTVNYHLIDIVSPNQDFSLAEYKKQAGQAIQEIKNKSKLPIIVGGTGLYLQAVVDNYNLSSVKPDYALREELEQKTREEVFEELKKYNEKFANKLNNSERNNKRHLIRYIEIAREGKLYQIKKNYNSNEFLILGLDFDKKTLEEKIYTRLKERLEQEGMIEEVKNLHDQHGVSYDRLKKFGLEYRYVSFYLQGELEYQEMFDQLFLAIKKFAKRQRTWFKRWERQGKTIHWIQNQSEAIDKVDEFLKS